MTSTLIKSREALLVIATLIVVGAVAIRFPGFIASANLANIFNDSAILVMLALGQMVVVLSRCIDLSVASNLALTGMIVATVNSAAPDLPVVLLLMMAVLIGALLGAINGVLVWKLDIPPIVVTLGTLTIYRGIIFLISDGAWINAHEMSDDFKALPCYQLLGLPVLSWLAILIVAVFVVLVGRTALGRAFYAVGGNPHAAVYAGIDIGYTRFSAFVISGAAIIIAVAVNARAERKVGRVILKQAEHTS